MKRELRATSPAILETCLIPPAMNTRGATRSATARPRPLATIDPDDFAGWVFPRLFAARVPRYEAIAHQHGYTVQAAEVKSVRDEVDFVALIEGAISRHADREA